MTVAMVAILLAQAQPMVPATPLTQAQAATVPQCELHVWGAGRPHFVPRGNLLVKVDPAQLDRANPLSNVNVFGTAKRAVALPDDELKRLLPAGAAVTIVRHEEMLDIDRTPLDKLSGPIAQSAPGCYADLIVANLYGLFPDPKAVYQPGLLNQIIAGLIVGKDRLVIDFRLRDFTDATAGGRTYKRKNDSPLPHLAFMTPEMKAAVEASAVVNLRSFVDYVTQQRGR
jgi:hypothetical protein